MSDSAVPSRTSHRPALCQGNAIGRCLARLRHTLMLWWRIRRDERFLYSQPDYLLKDIGLHRADIASAVRNRMPR